MFLARCFYLDLTYDLAAAVYGLFQGPLLGCQAPHLGYWGRSGTVNSPGFCLEGEIGQIMTDLVITVDKLSLSIPST